MTRKTAARWPNRDPLGERGFEVLRQAGVKVMDRWDGDPNLYDFVANGPINWIDPYGTCCNVGACRLAIAGYLITLAEGASKKVREEPGGINAVLQEQKTAQEAMHDNCKGCSASDILGLPPPPQQGDFPSVP